VSDTSAEERESAVEGHSISLDLSHFVEEIIPKANLHVWHVRSPVDVSVILLRKIVAETRSTKA
jgi:hypothetical protein